MRPTANAKHRETARHYGKYRGTVTDNQDPRKQARIEASVPEILGDVDSGGHSRAHLTPPTAPVFIRCRRWERAGGWNFEAGDVSRPIWVGCGWASDKLPKDEGGAGATPDVRMARSEQGLLLAFPDDSQTLVNISDLPNSRALSFDQGAGCTCQRMLMSRNFIPSQRPQNGHQEGSSVCSRRSGFITSEPKIPSRCGWQSGKKIVTHAPTTPEYASCASQSNPLSSGRKHTRLRACQRVFFP